MNTQTDWITAVAILAAGLVIGLLLTFFRKRRNGPTPAGESDLRSRDLTARRDSLVELLRDPVLSGDERQRLELETVEVLRKLDGVSGLSRTSSESSERKLPDHPVTKGAFAAGMKGFVMGVTTFAVLAGLGYFVMQQATPRTNGTAPVDPVAPTQPSPEQSGLTIAQLEAKVALDPENMQLRNDLAQSHLGNDNLMGVFEQTKVVLDQNPEDSRALTLQAVVRGAMGETELAMTMLKRAARSDPQNINARVALAWVFAQTGRIPEAEDTIVRAQLDFPAEKAMLDQVLHQMKMSS